MFAIVRRFQKATAVAPRIAELAMRNAVDQRPLLGAAFPESVPANSSFLDSCVLAFPEVPIILSFSVRQRIFRTGDSMAYSRTGRYLSLESTQRGNQLSTIVPCCCLQTLDFYGIWKKCRKKYMKNTNISCIRLDSVSSYVCKGMKLRC